MAKQLLTIFSILFYFSAFSQFTTNNLVVSQLGDGSINYPGGSAARCLLKEYNTSGTLISSTPMPVTPSGSNRKFMLNNGLFGGYLSLTTDSRYLLIAGYDVDELSQPLTSFTSQIAPRIVGIIDKNKNINTATSTGQYSGDAINAAFSTNGNDIWTTGGSMNGSGGVRYLTANATNSTLISTGDLTSYQIAGFGNQLYTSSGTSYNVGSVGTGFPTTTASISNLPGLPLGGSRTIVSFFFADLNGTVAGNDVLYVLNGDAFGGANELSKYSLVGTNWVLNNSIAITTPRAITGKLTGTTVDLYIVNQTSLLKLSDNSGYNSNMTASVVTLATAPANTFFKGVSFAPENLPLAPPPVPTVTGIQNNCINKSTPGIAKITNWVNGYTIVATKNGQPLTVNPVDTSFEYFTPGQSSGTYAIQVKFVNGGQNSEVNINHVVSSLLPPQLALLTVNTSTPYCINKSLSFSVTASNIGDNPTYTWRDGTTVLGTTTTPNFTTQFSTAGQKTINVVVNFTIGNNCLASNTATSADLVITIVANSPAPTISAGGTTSFCTGGSVILSSNASTGNQWYNGATAITGATNTSYTANTTGSYSVIATANGCTSASSNVINVVVNPLPATPVINFTGTQLTTAAGMAGYQWYFNNSAISGATSATYTPSATGLYKVMVTDANGCSATSAEYNFVLTAIGDVTLNGVTYSIGPNPVKEKIKLWITNGNRIDNVQVKIINTSGNEVLVRNNITSNTEFQVSFLPPGIYYVLVNGKKERGAFKIVVNH